MRGHRPSRVWLTGVLMMVFGCQVLHELSNTPAEFVDIPHVKCVATSPAEWTTGRDFVETLVGTVVGRSFQPTQGLLYSHCQGCDAKSRDLLFHHERIRERNAIEKDVMK